MFEQHNAARAANGVAPLVIDAAITGVARQRARDMAATGEFTHSPTKSKSYVQLLEDAGIKWRGRGENIAYNTYGLSETVDVAMNGFMNSSGHRANILNSNFKRVGVGIAIEGDRKYFAVIFIAP
jgi:uncharacterized protein YkwD